MRNVVPQRGWSVVFFRALATTVFVAVGGDRLVLGTVVLKNAPYFGNAPNEQEIADDDEQLESAGLQLKERRAKVDVHAQPAVAELRGRLRQDDEEHDGEPDRHQREKPARTVRRGPALALRSAPARLRLTGGERHHGVSERAQHPAHHAQRAAGRAEGTLRRVEMIALVDLRRKSERLGAELDRLHERRDAA